MQKENVEGEVGRWGVRIVALCSASRPDNAREAGVVGRGFGGGVLREALDVSSSASAAAMPCSM